MRKKTFRIMMGIFFTLLLVGCSSGNNNIDENISAGEAVYRKSCLSCHGDKLQGRNGPELATIGERMTKEEILQVIEEGRRGMPPNIVTGEDAELVAEWLAEQKGE